MAATNREEMKTGPLLSIEGLALSIGVQRPVDGVSLTIARGECLSLVGASGSGKTLTSLAVMGLLPPMVRIAGGAVRLDGRDLLKLPEPQWRGVRGRDVAMIFQEPMTSLNPVMTIGAQIGEAIELHLGCGHEEAQARAEALLREVQVPEAAMRLRAWPHQLSGGLRQRVMIAMALSCNPGLLIADEPTTALDVTVQASVMDLLRRIRRQRGLAILLITHDIALAAEVADRIAVIDVGRIVEEGTAESIVVHPNHEATRRLIGHARAREVWREA